MLISEGRGQGRVMWGPSDPERAGGGVREGHGETSGGPAVTVGWPQSSLSSNSKKKEM